MLYGYTFILFAAAWCLSCESVRYIAHVDPSKGLKFGGDCGNIGSFFYCSGDVDELFSLAADDSIIAIEPDSTVSVAGCQRSAPWHLQNHGSTYSYDPDKRGQNVTVYVVDTWVDTKHPEFQDRASLGFSNVAGEHYHGTHVAGIIASKTYGVAKKAKIVSVQVLNDRGTGSYSSIMEGLSWIAPRKKGIVNISIGGTRSVVFNRAVEALRDLGHIVVVAAGNEGVDACLTSPASASVITVGAIDQQQGFASFSNYGKCVTIQAPGVLVHSTLPDGKSGQMSGTSMASPFVAGVVAVFATGKQWPSDSEVRNWLLVSGLRNAIDRLPIGTKNIVAKQTLRDASCRPIKGGQRRQFLFFQNDI